MKFKTIRAVLEDLQISVPHDSLVQLVWEETDNMDFDVNTFLYDFLPDEDSHHVSNNIGISDAVEKRNDTSIANDIFMLAIFDRDIMYVIR